MTTVNTWARSGRKNWATWDALHPAQRAQPGGATPYLQQPAQPVAPPVKPVVGVRVAPPKVTPSSIPHGAVVKPAPKPKLPKAPKPIKPPKPPKPKKPKVQKPKKVAVHKPKVHKPKKVAVHKPKVHKPKKVAIHTPKVRKPKKVTLRRTTKKVLKKSTDVRIPFVYILKESPHGSEETSE